MRPGEGMERGKIIQTTSKPPDAQRATGIFHSLRDPKHGSKLHMMTHCVSIEKRNEILMAEGLDFNLLKNLKIVHLGGATSCRR